MYRLEGTTPSRVLSLQTGNTQGLDSIDHRLRDNMQGFLHDTWLSRQKDEWLTPPEIIRALGPFDLDPCAPVKRPWDTARHHFTIKDNGLIQPWSGRVWLNPPYGRHTPLWLSRIKRHGNGIALIFARTETKMFFRHIWTDADGILFLKGRISFFHADGTCGGHAGAPLCLVAYGDGNVEALRNSEIAGVLVTNNRDGLKISYSRSRRAGEP